MTIYHQYAALLILELNKNHIKRAKIAFGGMSRGSKKEQLKPKKILINSEFS